jgi:hypothetical protein
MEDVIRELNGTEGREYQRYDEELECLVECEKQDATQVKTWTYRAAYNRFGDLALYRENVKVSPVFKATYAPVPPIKPEERE